MAVSLSKIPYFVINLDRSHDRWVRSFQSLTTILPRENLHRVSGVDGREFRESTQEVLEKDLGTEDSPTTEWKADILRRLQREGAVGKLHLLDPVRTALCLSHQRAIHQFLDSGEPIGMVFEDDSRPGEALARLDPSLDLDVPEDFDVLFLHDRTWRKGASSNYENWRVVRGGIGLEAYVVTRAGARKILQGFRPVVEECDIQLMTFMAGYADLEVREEIWAALKEEGHAAFPSIIAYAPVRPYFQTDHWIPSVKFETMEEHKVACPEEGEPQPE